MTTANDTLPALHSINIIGQLTPDGVSYTFYRVMGVQGGLLAEHVLDTTRVKPCNAHDDEMLGVLCALVEVLSEMVGNQP